MQTAAKQSDVVITGAGLVTPLGVGCGTAWRGVIEGRCGLGAMSALEQKPDPDLGGGQAPECEWDEEERALPREVRYLRRAIREALDGARAMPGKTHPPGRCAVMLGTTLHGMRSAGAYLRDGDYGHFKTFSAASVLQAALSPWNVAGWSATTCSACSSGLGSIALGVTLLQSGQADLVIAGGYDTVSEYAYAGFNSLRVVADGPLRPFARERRGMKLAEGYGIVVLERAADASARGVGVMARILGIGESADAHHLTQPHPQGVGAAAAMRIALMDAGIEPGEVNLVCAHATGTQDNDAAEFAALSAVFGDHLAALPVVGLKSLLGHTLGGAGSVELILAAMAMRDQMIPSCVNVRADEVEFEKLKLVTSGAMAGRVETTLNTSLGFGGANTCVVLGKAAVGGEEGPGFGVQGSGKGKGNIEHPKKAGESIDAGRSMFNVRPSQSPRDSQQTTNSGQSVFITGIGVVVPGGVGNEAFAQLMARPKAHEVDADTGAVAEEQLAPLLNSRRVRRMSEYVKLSLAATSLAMADAAITDVPAFAEHCSAVLGSAHGSAGYSEQYYGQVVREGINAANPMLFAEGVPNAAAAHLSLMLGVKGACQTIIGARTAGLDALALAAMRIASGQWDRAIVSAGEEYAPVVNAAYGHAGLYQNGGKINGRDEGFVAGAGAVTLVLESEASLQNRGGRARGVVERWSNGASEPRGMSRVMTQVLASLGPADGIMMSGNRTWIERAENAAVRRAARGMATTHVYGHLAECHSALPLMGLAATLLNGVMPMTIGHRAPDGNAPPVRVPRSIIAVGADYNGMVAGVRVGLLQP